MTDTEKKPAIELANVNKLYHTYPTPRHRLLEIISGGHKRYSRETRALDDVSFSLEKGGRLGVVGENGSGKSTLLKVLAGVITPTTGTVHVRGRISALLELGAGLNPHLPGQENIRQLCMLHGMHRDEIDAALPEIIKFSELRDAIEHPVKTYSSGMAVRLGFACAVYVQPDILIVDEALSVGDAYFQNKCLHKIRSMLDQGITFIYVTHSADAIRSLCNEGLWLEKGKVRLVGASKSVGAAYQSEVFSRMVRSGFKQEDDPALEKPAEQSVASNPKLDSARVKAFAERVSPLRTGSGEILIDDISIIDESGSDTDSVGIDEEIRIRVFYHVESAPTQRAVLNVGIMDSSGRQLLHFNPMFSGIFASDAPLHIPQMMEVKFKNQLCPGEFGVAAGVVTLIDNPKHHGQTLIDNVIDYCPGGTRFNVRFPDISIQRDLWGFVHIDYKVSVESMD
jgi:lipopolysaccharide transport system ATP-binding protein